MRFFNTTGPVDCARHYCIDPLERIGLAEVLMLIEQQKYFVLHAPRQTGKTTCLLALMRYLNAEGRCRALYANVEGAQAAREDVRRGIRSVLAQIAGRAEEFLGDPFPRGHQLALLDEFGEDAALERLLSLWAASDPRPLVLFLDEIDTLIGDTLVSVLRQIRSGYDKRPAHFPQSIILCGVRDVRDYRLQSPDGKPLVTGGSAFNIRAKSLRLGDFEHDEVVRLLGQHTAETGQPFEPEALDAIWQLSCGQPWLVNALSYEVCFEMPDGRDRSRPITVDKVYQAKEEMILRRETHLDQLADKLREERVRRVIEPLLETDAAPESVPEDDVAYVRDLGLVRTDGGLHIANPIYREVIPRQLTYTTQLTIAQEPAWYIEPDGRLNMPKLMAAFQQFFREHSEHWLERFQYREAGPQLLLQAFLQRVINGGGRVEREYGAGRGRTDLLVIWPLPGGEAQRTVLELKVVRHGVERTISAGLEQTVSYMDCCGAREGHLVLFDRTPGKPWEEKVFHRDETHAGHTVSVWGM